MEHSVATILGRVASLHLHPATPGADFTDVTEMQLVAQKGIEGNPRYFAKRNLAGQPSRRQVTLIERGVIAEHAARLALASIPPGKVRSNIETEGINLVPLIGQTIRIGSAVLYLYDRRTPCAKMDAICPGLRKQMENGQQGVLAQVIESGRIAVGDPIVSVCDLVSAGKD